MIKDKREFVINRPEKYGGKITFQNYEQVEEAFASKKLASVDLKMGIADELVHFITPLRAKVLAHKKLMDEAYPLVK
jgi:tyrosyl-tRNA synthetase